MWASQAFLLSAYNPLSCMATDESMLKDGSQRKVQERLLQYYVAPPVARGLAQGELRHWIPDQLDSIFHKISGLTPSLRHFASDSRPL